MRFVGERDSACGSFKDKDTISLDPAAFLTILFTIGLVVITGISNSNDFTDFKNCSVQKGLYSISIHILMTIYCLINLKRCMRIKWEWIISSFYIFNQLTGKLIIITKFPKSLDNILLTILIPFVVREVYKVSTRYLIKFPFWFCKKYF